MSVDFYFYTRLKNTWMPYKITKNTLQKSIKNGNQKKLDQKII